VRPHKNTLLVTMRCWKLRLVRQI